VTDRPIVRGRAAGWEVLDRAAGTAWRLLVLAAALFVAVVALSRLRLVVLPLFAAVLVTVALMPVVRFLVRRRVPRLLATWIAFLGFIGVLAGVIALLAVGVAGELDELDATLEQGLEDVRTWLTDDPFNLSRDRIDRAEASIREQAREFLSGSRLASGAVQAAEFLAGAVIALVLVFFFLKDGERMRRWMLEQLPVERRPMAARLGARAWSALGGYLRGTAVIGLIEAVIVGVMLAVIGVPLIAPLVAITFLGAFFPVVGATVAGIITVLVTLVTEGGGSALVVAAVILAVQQLDGDILQPLVMGPAVKLHPVVILLALTAGSALGGIVGAFLAVPLTAVVIGVIGEWRLVRFGPTVPLDEPGADESRGASADVEPPDGDGRRDGARGGLGGERPSPPPSLRRPPRSGTP